jgi:hypothetical protein
MPNSERIISTISELSLLPLVGILLMTVTLTPGAYPAL